MVGRKGEGIINLLPLISKPSKTVIYLTQNRKVRFKVTGYAGLTWPAISAISS